MATRQMVSYDDITLPYDSSAECDRPPPAKKKKKNSQKAKQVGKPPTNPQVTVLRSRETNGVEDDMAEYDDDEEESRELTREEIWDDSALVDAWEAAQQEYEMYHGTSKDWKNEPVKKSFLWHNVPVDQTTKRTNGVPTQSPTPVTQSEKIGPAEPDSQPLNFDTFVPTHDPSLHLDPPLGLPAGSMVGQDEAFSRAMTAMYWGGYWTAMYHCQRNLSNPSAHGSAVDEPEADDETGEES